MTLLTLADAELEHRALPGLHNVPGKCEGVLRRVIAARNAKQRLPNGLARGRVYQCSVDRAVSKDVGVRGGSDSKGPDGSTQGFQILLNAPARSDD